VVQFNTHLTPVKQNVCLFMFAVLIPLTGIQQEAAMDVSHQVPHYEDSSGLKMISVYDESSAS
jgi:hypothetical protein